MTKNLKKSLKFKLLFYVWLCSAIATGIFTLIQVYYDYNQEVLEARGRYQTIKDSYISQIEESLWDYNNKYTQIQGESIARLPNVSYVEIKDSFDETLYSSASKDELLDSRDIEVFPLLYQNRNVGSLTIKLNIEDIKNTYIKKVFQTLILQSIKTFLVSTILLFIFSKLITNHLYQISNFMKTFQLHDGKRISLKSRNSSEDELHHLVTNINSLKEKLVATDLENTRLTKNLELLVEKRTKSLEEAKEKSHNLSRQSALGEMASGIAHEINNPLAIIVSNAKIILKQIKKETPDQDIISTCANETMETSNRILEITKVIRTLADIDTTVILEDVNIEMPIKSILSLYKERLKLSGINVRFAHNLNDSPAIINGNTAKLSQVFLNLFTNSMDALERIDSNEKWIEINITKEKAAIFVRITDNGIGISEEISNKIFDPFFSTKDSLVSSGLGLSLSRSLIKQLGGNIRLDPNYPNTSFLIVFPNKIIV